MVLEEEAHSLQGVTQPSEDAYYNATRLRSPIELCDYPSKIIRH